VAGLGHLDRLRDLPQPLSAGANALLGPPGGSCTWRSYSPFVPPRHLKRGGRNALEGQVAEELACRGLPSASVEILPWGDETRFMRHAVRSRHLPARQPAIDVGFALQLRFDRPVIGPISLGYGCHFGLGLFLTAYTGGSRGDEIGAGSLQ
jgi:CRISPR-associated protein Csb2